MPMHTVSMVELLGIYAGLLAGWGLWHARRRATAVPAEVEVARPAGPPHERGAAARRHLGTQP